MKPLLLFLFPLLGIGALAADRPQPNILFIFSDDHRHDALGVVNPLVKTPSLDKLAKGAVRFERAYATTAICSPARAAVLSGRYGTRSGVATLSDSLKFPKHSFAHYLREAGYRTAQFGKWHLGTKPAAAGFDHYARINGNGSWFQRKVDTNIRDLPNKLGGVFFEEFMADAVIDYLSDHAENSPDRPFVLWWCNQVPHVDGKFRYPQVGDERSGYGVSDMAVPDNWADPLTTKPPYLARSRFVTKSAASDYGGPGGYTNPAPGVRNATLGEDNVQQHMLEYFAAITALDVQLGHVLDRLEDPDGDGDKSDSMAGNTWVVFVGDNGWQTGHHKFTSKVLAYEESARVPLLVRAPGVAPRVEPGLVLNIDLTRMFLDIAGVPAAAHHQGRNLGDLVRNPKTPWRSQLYYEAVVPERSLGAMPHDSIRDERFKLIRTYAAKGGKVEFEELYDLENDPGEMVNLAMESAHSTTKAALGKALESQKARIASSPDPGAD